MQGNEYQNISLKRNPGQIPSEAHQKATTRGKNIFALSIQQ